MKKIIIILVVLFSKTVLAQSFEFSCAPNPLVYVDMFMEDAENYGYDFSSANITIEWIETSGFNAATPGRCNGIDRIILNRRKWITALGHTKPDLWRKYLIYHELGHALLNLRHVCTQVATINTHTLGPVPRFEGDIMWAYNECNSTHWALNCFPWGSVECLDNQIDRMFNLVGQNQDDCLRNKGSKLIYD